MNSASHTGSPAASPVSSIPSATFLKVPAGLVEEQKDGCAHLLKNHTFEEFKKEAIPAAIMNDLLGFLHDGNLYDMSGRVNEKSLKGAGSSMKQALLILNEPSVFLAVNDIYPGQVIISTKIAAETLLAAVQSRDVVSGIEIVVYSDQSRGVSPDFIEPLAGAFKLNNGLNSLCLSGEDFRQSGFPLLLDELCSVPDLKLSALSEEMDPAYLTVLARFLDKNRKLNSFILDVESDSGAEYTDEFRSVLEGIQTQGQLQCLALPGIGKQAQQALGKYIETSQTLGDLRIDLRGPEVAEELLVALRQNTRIKLLKVTVDNIEDNMLPLLDLLRRNVGSVTKLVLRTCVRRQDNSDMRLINDLIATNTTLSAFEWHFDRPEVKMDLLALASAIGKNRSLESIEIKQLEEMGYGNELSYWIKSEKINEFLKLLAKNRVLTNLVFSQTGGIDSEFMENKEFPEIAGILRRNVFYQKYLCSEGFIEGAASGFYAALGMQADPGKVTAPYILKQGPRAVTGSLALVNKTTYRWAQAKRREESIKAMKDALAPGQRFDKSAANMHALLQRVLIWRSHFSVEALTEIAGSPYLMRGIFQISDDSPKQAGCLVDLFANAVGIAAMAPLIGLLTARQRSKGQIPYS